MGIDAPKQAGPSISVIRDAAQAAFAGKKADRVFIYNPDAVALWLYEKYAALFEEADACSDLQLPMLSVMPSVTPVCFASMYTGVMPEVHGIRAYVKPVMRTDTVFDALLRAGKKPAIVSTAGDSISRIFLERDMDYFIYDAMEACNEKVLSLIEEDRHDLIVLYNGNYDATMHRHGPESAEALAALKHNIATYSLLVRQIEECWRAHRTMVGFCPDHGCHAIDGDLGSHGLDMPEDMNVIHFFKFI
jgi:predicted AlkP superfamily pyrophosphatase or phosphodiesterase